MAIGALLLARAPGPLDNGARMCRVSAASKVAHEALGARRVLQHMLNHGDARLTREQALLPLLRPQFRQPEELKGRVDTRAMPLVNHLAVHVADKGLLLREDGELVAERHHCLCKRLCRLHRSSSLWRKVVPDATDKAKVYAQRRTAREEDRGLRVARERRAARAELHVAIFAEDGSGHNTSAKEASPIGTTSCMDIEAPCLTGLDGDGHAQAYKHEFAPSRLELGGSNEHPLAPIKVREPMPPMPLSYVTGSAHENVSQITRDEHAPDQYWRGLCVHLECDT